MKSKKKKHTYKHVAKLQNIYAMTVTCLIIFLGYIIYFVHTYVYDTVIQIQEINFIQPDIQVETIDFNLLDAVNTTEQEKAKNQIQTLTSDPFQENNTENIDENP